MLHGVFLHNVSGIQCTPGASSLKAEGKIWLCTMSWKTCHTKYRVLFISANWNSWPEHKEECWLHASICLNGVGFCLLCSPTVTASFLLSATCTLLNSLTAMVIRILLMLHIVYTHWLYFFSGKSSNFNLRTQWNLNLNRVKLMASLFCLGYGYCI